MDERFGRDWWPHGVTYPAARLAGGLLAGALVAAAMATASAVTLASVTGGDDPAAVAVRVLIPALAGFMVFAATFGFAAMLGLWSSRRRDVTAFAAAGAACGVVFAFLTTLTFGQAPSPALPIAMGVAGALVLLVARFVAGIRPL